MNSKDLLEEAISLPVEERAILIDSLIKSLNPLEKEIEKKWLKVASKRLEEIQSEKVKPISGKAVFDKIWNTYK